MSKHASVGVAGLKSMASRRISRMTAEERLVEIAAIIERVDNRAMAVDGPVTPTLEEITQDEMSSIYKLAIGAR